MQFEVRFNKSKTKQNKNKNKNKKRKEKKKVGFQLSHDGRRPPNCWVHFQFVECYHSNTIDRTARNFKLRANDLANAVKRMVIVCIRNKYFVTKSKTISCWILFGILQNTCIAVKIKHKVRVKAIKTFLQHSNHFYTSVTNSSNNLIFTP